MTTQSSNQPKLSYEERLTAKLQEILVDNGIDASTHPDSYGYLVGQLADYVTAETRRSYGNGRRAGSQPERSNTAQRYYIRGKPTARQAGKIQTVEAEQNEDAFTKEEAMLE